MLARVIKLASFVSTLLAVTVFAATNSYVFKETRGNAQTNYVLGLDPLLSRTFKQGEVPSGQCPKPSIGGTPATTWQAEIHDTWSDGSAKNVYWAAIVPSVSANGTITVTFSNVTSGSETGACDSSGGLNKVGMTGFNSSNWGAQIIVTPTSGTAGTGAVTVDAPTMLSALSIAAGQIEYVRQGPVLTQVKVDDRTGTFAYDFGWHWNGTSMDGGGATSYVTTSQYASLHPIFYLTFVPSLNIVRVDYVLENSWTERLQDQVYSVVLKSGGTPTQVYSHASFTQYATTRWRKTLYSGTAQEVLQMDPNFAYLISTKAFPCYDGVSGAPCSSSGNVITPSTATSGSGTNGVTSYAQFIAGVGNAKCDMGGALQCTNAMSNGFSDNSEYAPVQREDLLYLYNASGLGTEAAKAWLMLTGQSVLSTLDGDAVSGGAGTWNALGNYYSMNQRMSTSATTFYCNNYDPVVAPDTLSNGNNSVRSVNGCGVGTGDTRGRVPSRHANGQSAFPPFGTAVGTFTDGGMTTRDSAHWQNWSYVGALLTGDPYLLDMMYMEAAYVINARTADCAGYDSCGFFGFINGPTRAQAQELVVARAAFLAPDSSAEKLYFTAMVASQQAVREGFKGTTGTSLTPVSRNASCTAYSLSATNRWDFGHCGYGAGNNLAGSASSFFPSLHEVYTGFCYTSEVYLSQCQLSSATSANPLVGTTSACTVNEVQATANPPFVWGATGAWTGMNSTDATNTGAASGNSVAHTITLNTVNSTGYSQPLTGTVYISSILADWSKASDVTEDWIDGFLQLSMTFEHEMGFSVVDSNYTDSLKRPVEKLLDNNFNPYLFSLYEAPAKGWASVPTWPPTCTTNPTTQPYFSGWGTAKSAFASPVQSISTFKNSTYNQFCNDHAYGLVGYAATMGASSITGSCSQGSCAGSDAITWLRSHAPFFNNTPTGSTGCGATDIQIKFALAPRTTTANGYIQTPNTTRTAGTVMQ